MRRLAVSAAVVVLAACSGGSSHSSSVANAQGSAAATSTSAALSPSPGSSASSGSSTGPSSGSGPAATSAPHGSGTPTTAHPNAPGVKPAVPATPGTYKYRQSGTTTFGSSTKPVPAEGTAKIDPVSAQGTQTLHRTVDSSQPPSDTVFLFRDGGVFLTQIVQRSNATGQTTTFTCTFAPPMPTPPWPPTVGGSYQGHADCGSFTIDVHGSVQGTKTALGRTAFVLGSTLAFHGQLEGSGTQTDWVDPTSSLILHEDTSQSLTYGGFVHIAGTVTSDLESLTPA